MSYFPSPSPQCQLLEYAQIVSDEYDLSKDELVIVLLNVISAIADPFDEDGDRIKRMSAKGER